MAEDRNPNKPGIQGRPPNKPKPTAPGGGTRPNKKKPKEGAGDEKKPNAIPVNKLTERFMKSFEGLYQGGYPSANLKVIEELARQGFKQGMTADELRFLKSELIADHLFANNYGSAGNITAFKNDPKMVSELAAAYEKYRSSGALEASVDQYGHPYGAGPTSFGEFIRNEIPTLKSQYLAGTGNTVITMPDGAQLMFDTNDPDDLRRLFAKQWLGGVVTEGVGSEGAPWATLPDDLLGAAKTLKEEQAAKAAGMAPRPQGGATQTPDAGVGVGSFQGGFDVQGMNEFGLGDVVSQFMQSREAKLRAQAFEGPIFETETEE